MNRRPLVLLFLLLALAACGGGSGAAPPPGNAPPPAGPSPAETLTAELAGLPLEQFYVASFAALSARSPEGLLWQSVDDVLPPGTIRLDDLSDSYQRDTFAMIEAVLGLLRNYDAAALDAGGRLDYDVYEWYLADRLGRLEFIYHDFPATYSIFGVPEDTRQLFTEIHPLASAQDAEDYIARLELVESKFSQLVSHLYRQRQNGIVEPALTLAVALNQVALQAEVDAAASPYFVRFAADLNDIPGLTTTVRADLESRALAAVDGPVRRGYRHLRRALEELLANAPPSIGVGQYPRGADYYAYMLRHHTTTELGAAELHQLGLDELSRIHAEMRLVFDQLGYPQNESLQQLFVRVENDGGIVPAADVLGTYETIIDIAGGRLDEAFDIFPAADVVVIADDFGGYYIGPSFDGTRPGAFYAGTRADEPWYQMPSLAYHEAVPGHHMQIAIAMEQDVPAFRKLLRFTAFVEGWALYAERLAWELGWYDGDPYANLGRLQYEALRAARLVMDTGIHAMNWSFDEAVAFNEASVGWSSPASQGAAARYSVSPGQATAYMAGMLQILDARQRARDALGARFDLKAFHRALLGNGAVPLALLDRVVDQYVDAVAGDSP